MAARSIKVSFTLDESDIAHFRKLYREARRKTSADDQPKIIAQVRKLVEQVRGTPKVPSFVLDAMRTLEDLLQMLDDEDYALPKAEASRVLAALAYFVNPEDLIPDHIPGLGFLDDAIMIKFVEDEFKDELWGYRKFRKFRSGAEQRPWTGVARKRLPERLVAYRKKIREEVKKRSAGAGPRLW